MEYINRIEIQGNIGSVRIIKSGEKKLARLTVLTNHIYKAQDGCPVVESTWHAVSVWENDRIKDLESLHKGQEVHVKGRLRCTHFTDAQGMTRTISETVASEFETLS